jgi:hypothetical protein
MKHPEFALSVAVVDTRSFAGVRNHCKGSVQDPNIALYSTLVVFGVVNF